MAIGGGRDFPRDATSREAWLARVTALCEGDRYRAITLLDRYGTRGEAVARHCAGMNAGGACRQRPLDSLAGYRVGEIDFACRFERVEHLADVLFRRLPIALAGLLDSAVIEEVATLCSGALAWSEDHCRDEIDRVREIAMRTHGVSLAPVVDDTTAGATELPLSPSGSVPRKGPSSTQESAS
ncbi:glycerol-3-phosphate dehydrogenase C-terminal domain-containing protein [Salinicola acroporae]|uniref:glycerol-3-phosphate dehydrogenase C-terminal domain-containing protein n=1 Tax=Salinicola acroporae TaxID=1541440 RepID=UPI0024547CFB|nr:glycerol-3-phosphate dehydrogenase C-terminal domain-containing protein [Salinicola acroporae]